MVESWLTVFNVRILTSNMASLSVRMQWSTSQAFIWINAEMLLTEPLGTNFSEILIEIYIFSLKNALEMSSGKWQPFCLGLNVPMTAAAWFEKSEMHKGIVQSRQYLILWYHSRVRCRSLITKLGMGSLHLRFWDSKFVKGIFNDKASWC